jgi:hypothetical protein
MSYDVSLAIDTGAPTLTHVVDCGNYTYNVGTMFRKALGGKGLYDLNGVEAWKVIAKLRLAVDTMRRNRDEYEALNPENGWGNYEGALEYLVGILKECEQHSKCVILIH